MFGGETKFIHTEKHPMLFDLLIVLLVAFLASAVLNTSLLPAAISLACASIVATLIFYMFGAVWVAIFELTIVAGLITVLFISAISLTRDLKEQIESDKPLFYFPLIFILVVILAVLGTSFLIDQMPARELTVLTGTDDFQLIFWRDRKLDILGQTAVILAGIFGIAAFFRKVASTETAASSPLDIALTHEDDQQEAQEANNG